MANFSALKTAIQNAIRQNGNEEITGNLLQQILLSVVNTMGDAAINTIEQNLSQETLARQNGDNTLQSNINAEALARGNADTQLQNAINAIKANIDNGYVYAGIATPSSTPVSGKVFYIATAAGTYTSFGSQVLTQGINILRFNGSAWSSQQLIGIDDVPTAGSNSLVKSGGVQNELALGAVYDVSAKNPTAGPNNDGKWESLSALLSDANLNTLIPTAYRKGGMSIKFVHTNDNNYIRYNLLADTFTTDTTKWAIDDAGVYVENPEFLKVITDKDGKILWAIETNGNIRYGAGVPPQVVDYINDKIAELSLDEYEDIVSFLGNLITGDKTLQQLLATKVDEEEGKSLIPTQYIQEVENSEFVAVYTDSEDKILFALRVDGDFYFGYGVPSQIVKYVTSYIQTNVFNGSDTTTLDGLQKITAFLDGFTTSETLKHYLDNTYGKYVESPEFIEAKTDSQDKIIEGFRKDGTKVIGGNLKVGGSIAYGDKDLNEELETKVDKIEGKGLSTNDYTNDEKTVVNTTELIEDPEGRLEIATDSENKIISYRKEDGTKVENIGFESPKITTNSLNLSKSGMTEFQQALKDSGFRGGAGDWSDVKSINIPVPKCAIVNFTNINNMPQYKGVDYHAYMEFWDMNGNYFKKKAILNAQGNSSLGDAKKNVAIDICNDDWEGDDTFSIKFGDWVAQDSFHAKAYWKDFFKGIPAPLYSYYRQIISSREWNDDRVWKRALLPTNIPMTSDMDISTDLRIDTGATNFPQGFPCIFYLNGEFYGIFSWQIKKHRDNYHMNKSIPEHIHLDGDFTLAKIWLADGTIDWELFGGQKPDTQDGFRTKDGIEIRNPKSLVYAGKDTYHNDTSYTGGEKVIYGCHLYKSIINNNLGNLPTDNTKWEDLGKLNYKYDADDPGQFEIAGNADGSSVYDDYVEGVSYAVNKIVKWTDENQQEHLFINTVDNNIKAPVIDFEGDKNTDSNPDFKNKTKCGWINCTNTVKVKEYIINLSKRISDINTEATVVRPSDSQLIVINLYKGVYDSEINYAKGNWVSDGNGSYFMNLRSANTGHPVSDADYWYDVTSKIQPIKELVNTYFDVHSLIDYIIFGDTIWNWDGFRKNWQWTTYDGVKWSVNPYDLDYCLGHAGSAYFNPLTEHLNNKDGLPTTLILYYFQQELNDRYSELRKLGIVDASNITNLIGDWTKQIGIKFYELENKKWPFAYKDSLSRIYKWCKETINNLDSVYNYNN